MNKEIYISFEKYCPCKFNVFDKFVEDNILLDSYRELVSIQKKIIISLRVLDEIKIEQNYELINFTENQKSFLPFKRIPLLEKDSNVVFEINENITYQQLCKSFFPFFLLLIFYSSFEFSQLYISRIYFCNFCKLCFICRWGSWSSFI